MSAQITMRRVLELWKELEVHAFSYTKDVSTYRSLELHDAALAYAAAVRKVARRSRDQ